MKIRVNKDKFDLGISIMNDPKLRKIYSLFMDRRLYIQVHSGKIIPANNKEMLFKYFGKQMKVKIFTHKNYIWSFSVEEGNKFATIYCLSDKTGNAWEYKPGSDEKLTEKLCKSLFDYLLRMDEK